MINLTANIEKLPETDPEGYNRSRNKLVTQSIERFEQALKSLGNDEVYRRVLLTGKVTKHAELGEHSITPMENVDDELLLKVLQVYSGIKWG